MTPTEFIRKWKPVALTERAAAHTHFLDLCKLFEHEDPVSADPTGEWFAFEKGATKTGGGEGFADVWKKNFFAWEYKKKKRDLKHCLLQLRRLPAGHYLSKGLYRFCIDIGPKLCERKRTR
jgi:hypothetical protein